MGVLLSRRLFTVEEYHRMAQAGILHEDDRVELIAGE
ncbi:MAG: Uma2 family endonuclease, partial [Nitrospinota bacterium]